MNKKEFELNLEKREKYLNECKKIRLNTTIGYFDLNRLEEEAIRKYKLEASLKDDKKKKVKNALIKFWSSSEGNISDVKRYKYLLDIVIDRFKVITDERINKAILSNEEYYRISNLNAEENTHTITYDHSELNKFRVKRDGPTTFYWK